MILKNVWGKVKGLWPIPVIIIVGLLAYHTCTIGVDWANIKKAKKWISAEIKDLPVFIDETEDMVGITIYYPSGKSKRLIITVQERDEIIDRQLNDQDISDLIPKEEAAL